jgi:hypothetical protein
MLSAVKALGRPTGILTDMPGRITSSAFIGRQVELESLWRYAAPSRVRGCPPSHPSLAAGGSAGVHAELAYHARRLPSVHVSNIMAKLEAANRTEAGAKARALRLDRL